MVACRDMEAGRKEGSEEKMESEKIGKKLNCVLRERALVELLLAHD